MIHLANDHGGYSLGMKLFDKMVEKKCTFHITGVAVVIFLLTIPYLQKSGEEVQFLDFAVGILICGTGIE